MEVGDLGHHGIPALLPVVEESRLANVSALTLCPNMEERIVLVMTPCLKSAINKTAPLVSINIYKYLRKSSQQITFFTSSYSLSLQMVVFPTHASVAQGAPASSMAPSSVASVHLAILVMASPAMTLTSVKRSLMLAILIMESIAVRTQNPVTTVFPAHHVSLALSPLEEELNRQWLKNRSELSLTLCVCGY